MLLHVMQMGMKLRLILNKGIILIKLNKYHVFFPRFGFLPVSAEWH